MIWFLASAIPTVIVMATSDIKSDEVVVFYPTYAHPDQSGKTWTVLVHGIIYEPEQGSIKRSLAAGTIRRAVRVEAGTSDWAIFDRRARLFMVDNERGKEIAIRLGRQVYPVGTSGPNGHFSGGLQLPAAEADRLLGGTQAKAGWISFQAVTREGDSRRFAGRAQLIGRTGLSVISDIDDTIKDSQVGDRRAMMRNTFLREFQPVPGMAEMYRGWAQRGVVFHYVSGSPWQLYTPLSDFFRAEGFPPGSVHLKLFRLTDSTVFSLLASQEKTKLRAIEPILAAFPRRRFILVGDSGEEDPEIYGKIARQYGDRIAAILIRNVSDEAADGRRLRAAFAGIDPKRWRLFRQPEELRRLLSELGQAEEIAR